MHSRVFKIYIPEKEELKDEKKIKENISEVIGLIIEEDMIDLKGLTGMDWFDSTSNEQFKEDIDWLISAYTNSSKKEHKINKNNFIEVDGQPIYELKGEEFEKLRDAIKEELNRRVKEVEEMFKQKNKNAFWFWNAAKTLYPRNGFLFYIDEYGLVNDVEFYFAIKDADRIYIVESYDYHF